MDLRAHIVQVEGFTQIVTEQFPHLDPLPLVVKRASRWRVKTRRWWFNGHPGGGSRAAAGGSTGIPMAGQDPPYWRA